MKSNQKLIHSFKSFDFDAQKEASDYHVHGLHAYPARMHPYVAKVLIEQLSDEDSIIYEPFCGSGTVLVEALLHGNRSIGVDSNPLATLITRVKTTPIGSLELNSAYMTIERDLRKFRNCYFKDELSFDSKEINLQYWFKYNTIKKLSVLYFLLNSRWLYFDDDVLDFVKLCFARLVREVSTVRKSEFKLYRKPPEMLTKQTKPVFRTFLEILQENIHRMNTFHEIVKAHGFTKMIPKIHNIRNEQLHLGTKADLIITSPPYGDNATTVAYGQFSRYPLLWLGYPKEIVYSLDKLPRQNDDLFYINNYANNSRTYRSVIRKIKYKDVQRAHVVELYFDSLIKSLITMNNSLRSGGKICLIIGPRTVRKIVVPTPKIIKEMSNHLDLNHLFSIERNISSKTLPIRNSSGRTILKEQVMILEKR